jgi:iron complex outermembrane receptor protein
MEKTHLTSLIGVAAGTLLALQGTAQAAQVQAPAGDNQPASQPATPAEAPAAAAASQDPTSPAPASEIVVTGIRRSLAASQNVKRNAPTIVEAITPEDLGKFTDNSIADQLQRVPGVQIDRNNDGRSGDHVSILGLGAEFVTTTVNGRSPAGYGSEGLRDLREFAVDVLPSEVLSGVSIYKSPSAELVESGLGGEVDFQTLRPLDYRAPNGRTTFGSITAKTTNNDTTGAWGKGVSGIFGTKLFDDHLGIVVSGLINDNPDKIDFMEDRPDLDTVNVRNASGGVNQQTVVFPGLFDSGQRRLNTKRRAFNADVQWQPTDTLDVNFDYTYSSYNRPEGRNYDVIGPFDAGTTLDGVFEPGGITIKDGGVTSLDFTKYTPSGSYSPVPFGVVSEPIVYNNKAVVQIGGVNAKYHNDRFVAAVDLSLNKMSSVQNFGVGISNEQYYPSVTGVNYTANSSGPATLNNGAPLFNSASDFSLLGGVFRRYYKTAVSGGSAKVDLAYTLSDAITLKAGARYFQATVDVRDISQFAALTPAQAASVQSIVYPGGNVSLFPGFDSGRDVVPFEDLPALFSYNNGFVPPLNLSGPLATGRFLGATQTEDGWALNPLDSHRNVEQTLAGYVQADFKGEIFDTDFSGNVGVRLVQTWEEAQAFQSANYIDPNTSVITRQEALVPEDEKYNYLRALPAANLNFHPQRDINLRLAISEAMSRPEYELMAPINTLNIPDPTSPGYTQASRGAGAIGNVRLKPETSWNYIVSAEKYTSSGGSYVISGFYKSVKDFIAPVTNFNTTVPGQGSQLFDLTEAENVSGGKAYGAEISFNQPFRVFLRALDGFGLQGNYVYLKSKINAPFSGHTFTFPGASKNSVSSSLYYSKHGLDARVAMTYRSNYLSQLPILGLVAFPTYTEHLLTLDASVSYNLTQHLNLTLSMTNITKQDRRDYVYSPSFFLNYYQIPRTVAIALRASL